MTLLQRYPRNHWMDQFINDVDRLFDLPARSANESETPARSWLPAADIYEEQTRFVVALDLPGVESGQVDLNVEKGVLTINGERKVRTTGEGANCRRMERVHGGFSRRFQLPENIDAEHINAQMKDGVLEVVIPKLEPVKPRKIEING